MLDISDRSARIELRSVPTQYDISLGSSIFKDFNDDGIYDIKVTLDGINAQSKSVKLTVKAVQIAVPAKATPTTVIVDTNESEPAEVIDVTTNAQPITTQEESRSSLGYIILAITLLVIVVLVALFSFSKSSKKGGFSYN